MSSYPPEDMWKPASRDEIASMIGEAEWLMEPQVKAFWDRIKTVPMKWQLSPWGDEGAGFWVVALFGQTCLYYNDIEDGFNESAYEQFGQIKDYSCNQSDLLDAIRACHSEFCDWKK